MACLSSRSDEKVDGSYDYYYYYYYYCFLKDFYLFFIFLGGMD